MNSKTKNTNNNNMCNICKETSGEKKCSCSLKTCNECNNKWRKQQQRTGVTPSCPGCRKPKPKRNNNAQRFPYSQLYAQIAAEARAAAAERRRRSAAPSPEPRLHSGGLVRKTGSHRLLKGEIVLSRAQRRGMTHAQIVKILKSIRKM